MLTDPLTPPADLDAARSLGRAAGSDVEAVTAAARALGLGAVRPAQAAVIATALRARRDVELGAQLGVFVWEWRDNPDRREHVREQLRRSLVEVAHERNVALVERPVERVYVSRDLFAVPPDDPDPATYTRPIPEAHLPNLPEHYMLIVRYHAGAVTLPEPRDAEPVTGTP